MHPSEMHAGRHDLAWLGFGPEIATALFAVLVLYSLALLTMTSRRQPRGLAWLRGRTLHRDLAAGLGLLAVVPAIALSLVLASNAIDQREDRAASLLYEAARAVATQIDQYFEKHESGIASLAASIARSGHFDADEMSGWLSLHHAVYTDYLTMLATDAAGDIVVASALVAGRPQRIADLQHNVSDRAYFSVPMREGGIYVSDAFRGRGIGDDPIVAVSSAIEARDGTRLGVVEGSVDLSVMAMFNSALRGLNEDSELAVVDTQDRVIYASNGERYPALSRPAALARGVIAPGHGHMATRSTDGSHLVAEHTTAMGWRVVARTDVRPIHAQVLADFRITVVWVLATVAIAAMLSVALARRVRDPLQALKDAVRSLDLDGVEASIQDPPGAPDEIRDVFGHLKTVSERMHNSYRQLSAASEAGKHYREQLEQTLARRDAEIERRTRELEDTNRKLLTLSNVDALTSLPNRRCLLDTLDRAWRHGMREQRPVAIAVIDLDYFKAYNDNYGHHGGDQCLIRVGAALASAVGRPLDTVARSGGEEFVMVLGGTELGDALAIAERTRQLVEDLAIPHKGSPSDSIVTMSCGVACAVPRRGSHYDDLIKLADRALYHAKERGRNVVAWAQGNTLGLHGDHELSSTGGVLAG